MPTEQQVQKKISDKLEKLGWYVIRLIKTNTSGTPDLLALKKEHKPFFVEVKRTKGGIVSPIQKYIIKTLNKAGFVAIVANSWDAVSDRLKEEEYGS
jgi:hypothetical protein